MSRSRGDQIVVTSLLGLVLVVAGMLVADGFRRSREAKPRTQATPSVVEVAPAPEPAPAPPPSRAKAVEPDNGLHDM